MNSDRVKKHWVPKGPYKVNEEIQKRNRITSGIQDPHWEPKREKKKMGKDIVVAAVTAGNHCRRTFAGISSKGPARSVGCAMRQNPKTLGKEG